MFNLTEECINLTNIATQSKVFAKKSNFFEIEPQQDAIVIMFADKETLETNTGVNYIFTFNDIIINAVSIIVDSESAKIVTTEDIFSIPMIDSVIEINESIDEESGTVIIEAKTIPLPNHLLSFPIPDVNFYPVLNMYKERIIDPEGDPAYLLHLDAYLSPVMLKPVKIKEMLCRDTDVVKYERCLQNFEFDAVNGTSIFKHIGFYKGGIIIHCDREGIKICLIRNFIDNGVHCTVISEHSYDLIFTYERLIYEHETNEKNFIFDKTTFVGMIDDKNEVIPYFEGALADIGTLEEKNEIIKEYVGLYLEMPSQSMMNNLELGYKTGMYTDEDIKKLYYDVQEWTSKASDIMSKYNIEMVFVKKVPPRKVISISWSNIDSVKCLEQKLSKFISDNFVSDKPISDNELPLLEGGWVD